MASSIAEIIANNRNIDATPKSEAEKSAAMNKEQFLTLLVAQLQNQDPLNPMESTEFTSQLAQFSSLEQMIEVNKNLLDIKSAVSVDEHGDPINYIGKAVKADDNTIIREDGNNIAGSFSLNKQSNVRITINDRFGRMIRKMEAVYEAGEHMVEWDGRTEEGFLASDGTYSYNVYRQNAFGNYELVDTYSSGEVTGVTHANGQPYLLIGDKKVALPNVLEVRKIENAGG
ncbi:MAG: flagellar basal-body rod modification protein FlgD [Candidatus Magnetoglobus multicellularis str. Araruama]|uniref:Basal-body rod modification protein FlgD n=1 Tax=Candidatus Magnetoglobus multicellularis str. Araruama TaxID=890399 RepID=A0A1V1P5A2_9BACT|nr:MAG: flagellar basal-body rod modification protein FlgD [Candidatus Magnetoglobus multicellularis str. Araruama]